METLIPLNGRVYTFETDTSAQKTALKFKVESTPIQNKKSELQALPSVWLITASSGIPLFALNPIAEDQSFRILTAKQLYANRHQWFEPLADNYRELIWKNPESLEQGTSAYSPYKHLTWQEIIEFAKVDRPSIKYYSGFSGDWKKSDDGGAGYLLVMIEDSPYWADAIGQIPFAVDTYKMYYERMHDAEKAIIETVQTGISWGEGTVFGSSDPSNEYDNYMVLRGCLWAKENHRLIKQQQSTIGTELPQVYEVFNAVFYPTSNTRLISSIDATSAELYGVWRQAK